MLIPRTITVTLALLVAAPSAHAQFWDRLTNPEVRVTINHPPGLGINVNKIAFGPATGKCSDQIVDALISDFVSNQIEVMDRQNIDAILAEQHLGTSGHFDQANTAELGKILGPSAMIFVKTARCETRHSRLHDTESRYDPNTKKSYNVRAYYAQTQVFLKTSIQTVDLTTGRIFAARTLEYSPKRLNKSYDGYPSPPAEFEVLDEAVRSAVSEVHRMVLPWSETTELVYYDDKTCNLKQAFQLLKVGDSDGALEQSLANLESCKTTPEVKDKVLGHAYYNVGLSYMILGQHDKALDFLQEGARLRPGEIVTKAIADCRRANQLAIEMQQLEASIVVDASGSQDGSGGSGEIVDSSALTNDDVIQMVRSKLPDAVILHKIDNSKRAFDTSPEGLAELTNAGASEAVLIKMISP